MEVSELHVTLDDVQRIIDRMEDEIPHDELPEHYDSLVKLRDELKARS